MGLIRTLRNRREAAYVSKARPGDSALLFLPSSSGGNLRWSEASPTIGILEYQNFCTFHVTDKLGYLRISSGKL